MRAYEVRKFQFHKGTIRTGAEHESVCGTQISIP